MWSRWWQGKAGTLVLSAARPALVAPALAMELRRRDAPAARDAGPAAAVPLATAAAVAPRETELAPRLHLEMVVVAIAASMQMLYTVKQWRHSTAWENALAACTVVNCMAVASLLTMGTGPGLYRQHRVWLYAIFRPLCLANPALRNTQSNAAVLLARHAVPGALGLLGDCLRLLLGSRLLGIAVVGSVVDIPPAVTLLVQAASVALTSHSPVFCTSQLMSHALTQRRAEFFVGWMDVLTLPFSAAVPESAEQRSGSPFAEVVAGAALGRPEQQCQALLFFLQTFVGILVPTAIIARGKHAVPAWTPATSAAAQLAGPFDPPGCGRARRVGQRVWWAAVRAAHAVNWAVWRCCNLPSRVHGLMWWLAASLLWCLTLGRLGL